MYRLLTLVLLLFVLSCSKERNTEGDLRPDSLIEQAKASFSKEIAKASNQARASATSDPFQLEKWHPQWNSALTFVYAGTSVVEVPLLYGVNELTYKISSKLFPKGSNSVANGVTKAVFFKHKDGSMGLYLMTMVLDDNYFQAKQNNNQYKDLSLSTVSQDFSGFFTFSSLSGKLLETYRFEGGKVLATTRKKSGSTSSGRRMYCNTYTRCDAEDRVNYTGCCNDGEYNYNPTGNCCRDASPPYHYTVYNCYDVYDCYDDPPTEPGPGGDPGPGNDPNPNTDVENNISNPCVRGQVDAIINADVKNYIQSMFNEVFNNQKGLNLLSFQENNSMGPSARTVVSGNNPLTLTTYLNINIVGSASKEYTTMTIYHEIVHAILDNDGSTFNQFDQHVDMTQNYIDRLVVATRALDPGLSTRDAQALALFGLGEVFNRTPDTYQQVANRYGLSVSEISTIGTAYRRDTDQKSGTACN